MFSAILALIAIGAVVYLAIQLTISFIKNFRKRRNSKVLAANMGDLIRKAERDPNTARMSFSDLDEDETVLAEVDQYGEVVQCAIADDTDAKVTSLLDRNNGMIILED